MADLRALSDAALVAEVEAAKKELLLLGVKKATRQEVKCHQFVVLRRKVAMLKTLRRQRELEQGVNKRASRKTDKQMQLAKTYW